jgi:signal peptidase I
MITRKGAYSAIAAMLCIVFGALLATGCGAGGAATASTGGATGTPTTTATAQGSRSRTYVVRAGSMEPTLPLGTKATFDEGQAPRIGAIVIAHPPAGAVAQQCGPKPHTVKTGGAACSAPITQEAEIELVERVVAGPGDQIYIREGHVFRRPRGSKQFVRESDSYIKTCGGKAACDFPTPIRVAAGHWFLMGDNRGESTDSRYWGPVPTAWILGVVVHIHKPNF